MIVAHSRIVPLLAGADAAQARGNSAEQLRLLEEALRVVPDSPHALNSRGMRALTDRDFVLARDLFAAAARFDPGEPALWINVATATRALGDEHGEHVALDTVLAIDRRHFTANLRKAELHERSGEGGKAAQFWSGVVQMADAIADAPPGIVDAAARGRAFLTKHSAGLSQALNVALGDRVASLGVSARRFAACVDASLGRRRIYVNDCAGLHFPFLPADEFFDRDAFPWFAMLEAQTAVIRDEALALVARGGGSIRPYVRMETGLPDNKWSTLDHSTDWSAAFLWEYGTRNEAVCALCPQTAAALDALPQTRIPGKAPSAFFSILRAGAHIPAHTGVTNTRAIIHLPLVVPTGCGFRVGGETRQWREGDAFAFDDTIEHEAWNSSDQDRIVLIFDVWNPHLTPDEQDLLVDYFAVATPA